MGIFKRSKPKQADPIGDNFDGLVKWAESQSPQMALAVRSARAKYEAEHGEAGFRLFLSDFVAKMGDYHEQAGDLNKARNVYETFSEAGVPEAMFRLGRSYATEGDMDSAIVWYGRAGDAGHAEAMLQAGIITYLEGDTDAARFWLEKAAELGNPKAMVPLARLLKSAGDEETARMWIERAADLGDETAKTIINTPR